MDEYRLVVAHQLRSLTRFSGRDERKVFWPYAAFLLAIAVPAIFLAMSPAIFQFFRGLLNGSGNVGFSATSLLGMPVVAILMVMLSASAVVRRLHDTGLSGWVGLVVVVLLAAGGTMTFRVFASLPEMSEPANAGPSAEFVAAVVLNFAYNASLWALLALLTRPGSDNVNRFGARDSDN